MKSPLGRCIPSGTISTRDFRVMNGMRYSPPLKRHLSLKENWHLTPYGQTWPQQQLIACGHSRSKRRRHDQWLHSTKRQPQTIVQKPARGLLCTVGKLDELFLRQVIFMRVPATTLIYGP